MSAGQRPGARQTQLQTKRKAFLQARKEYLLAVRQAERELLLCRRARQSTGISMFFKPQAE